MVSAWRLVKRKHARSAFNGEGARRFVGRWNHPGTAVVYTAASRSLAALEMLVHLDSATLLQEYVACEVGIGESLITRLDASKLPRDWAADPPPDSVRLIGDRWVAEGSCAVMEVPSAVIPSESVFLLNPAHADFAKLRLGEPLAFRFDRRLAGKKGV
jgi:RES domain-containing protein